MSLEVTADNSPLFLPVKSLNEADARPLPNFEQPLLVLCSERSALTERLRKGMAENVDWISMNGALKELLRGLVNQLRGFSHDWPPAHFYISSDCFAELVPQPNLYPPLSCFVQSHVVFFDELRKSLGKSRWGLIVFDLDINIVHYFRWLFPLCRIVLCDDSVAECDFAYCETSLDPMRAPISIVEKLAEFKEVPQCLTITAEDATGEDFWSRLSSFFGFNIIRRTHANVVDCDIAVSHPEPLPSSNRFTVRSTEEIADTRRQTVLLVPYNDRIVSSCENCLRQAEKQGYTVWREPGFLRIDAARSVMATRALDEGFEELIWVDSDIVFGVDAIDRLRSHGAPLVGGVYAKKGPKEFAVQFERSNRALVLGQGAGLTRVRNIGTGFLLCHRFVYEMIEKKFDLPRCKHLGHECVPFFLTELLEMQDDYWYPGEDYGFVLKAIQCGVFPYADFSIRLGHVGEYSYDWEDGFLGKRSYARIEIDV